jgi:hypothetical protein
MTYDPKDLVAGRWAFPRGPSKASSDGAPKVIKRRTRFDELDFYRMTDSGIQQVAIGHSGHPPAGDTSKSQK